MKTFKTQKGTELPLLNLKGKDYLQVAHRLVWFREEKPEWQIETEMVTFNENYVIFKATIKNEKGVIISTAHKREDIKHFADNIEKAETGSIGRAVALVGYGTQFAPEFDEGERLADSPLPSINPAKPKIEPLASGPSPYEAFTARQDAVDAIKDEDWKIPFSKKYKGIALGMLEDDEIANMIAYFQNSKDGPSGQAIEFIERGNRVIQRRHADD